MAKTKKVKVASDVVSSPMKKTVLHSLSLANGDLVDSSAVVDVVADVDSSDSDIGSDCGISAGQAPDRAPDVHLVLAVDRLNSITEDIRRTVSGVASSFVEIGSKLCEVRDDPSLLADCGYSDIYDYAQKELGFGKTSSKNLMEVSSKFSKGGRLLDQYKDYSFSKLVELVPVSDDIDSYKPTMSVREIRNKKVLAKAASDYDSFMAFFLASFASSFSKIGFESVKVVALKPGDDGFISSYGPFQVSGSMKCRGRKCSFVVCFQDGSFRFTDISLGSEIVSCIYSQVRDLPGLSEIAWKDCIRIAGDADREAAAKAEEKAASFAGGSSSGKSPYELWLGLSRDQKRSAVKPSSVAAFGYGRDCPFFLNPYNSVDNVGLHCLSPLGLGSDSRFLVVGRFVPDRDKPADVVCVELLFCFLGDSVRTYSVLEDRDFFDDSVIGELDSLAKARVDAAKTAGASK